MPKSYFRALDEVETPRDAVEFGLLRVLIFFAVIGVLSLMILATE